MADIELVIKIPEEMYEWINDANKFYKDYGISDFVGFIKNGILLPKGHGNLIDADMVEEMKQMMQGNTDEKIAALTECEESYAKGYEDGRKTGHEAGYKAAHEAIMNIIIRVLEEIKP